MTQQPVLNGLIPPMITPLTPHGEIDQAAIGRHVSFLIEGGVTGIFVLGTSGEGPWLTRAQAEQVISATARAAAGRIPVLAGALEPGTRRAGEAVRRAADFGADAVVVTSPYYFTVSSAMQRRHFEQLADISPVPVVLYNIPSMTHNPLLPETVGQLLSHDRIVGIKDSAGDWEVFTALLTLRAQKAGFCVLQGAEQLAARSLLAGADGLVPGLGNCAPDLFSRMIAQARAGDSQGVDATQAEVTALWELHSYGFWLACLKYAVSLRGQVGAAVSAGGELSDEAKANIRRIVAMQTGPVSETAI